MGVDFRIDILLFFLCQISIIQSVTVPLPCLNSKSSYPESELISLLLKNENPEIFSNIKTKKDINKFEIDNIRKRMQGNDICQDQKMKPPDQSSWTRRNLDIDAIKAPNPTRSSTQENHFNLDLLKYGHFDPSTKTKGIRSIEMDNIPKTFTKGPYFMDELQRYDNCKLASTKTENEISPIKFDDSVRNFNQGNSNMRELLSTTTKADKDLKQSEDIKTVLQNPGQDKSNRVQTTGARFPLNVVQTPPTSTTCLLTQPNLQAGQSFIVQTPKLNDELPLQESPSPLMKGFDNFALNNFPALPMDYKVSNRFNTPDLQICTPTISPARLEDTQILEPTIPLKSLPNWETTQTFLNDAYTANKEVITSAMARANIVNYNSASTLPRIEIKARESATPLSDSPNTIIEQNTDVNFITLPKPIISIPNIVVPSDQMANPFDSTSIKTSLTNTMNQNMDVTTQTNNLVTMSVDNNICNIQPLAMSIFSPNVPCELISSEVLNRQKLEALSSETLTQQQGLDHALPQSSDAPISTNTLNEYSMYTGPIMIPSNSVSKPINDYTDYLSNYLNKLVPDLTSNIIADLLVNSQKKLIKSVPPSLVSPPEKSLTGYSPTPKKSLDYFTYPIINPSSTPSITYSGRDSLNVVSINSADFINLLNCAPNKCMTSVAPSLINPCNTAYFETPISPSIPVSYLPNPFVESLTYLYDDLRCSAPNIKMSKVNTDKSIMESSMPYIASITINVMPPKQPKNNIVVVL